MRWLAANRKTIVHKQNTKRLHFWDRNETRYNPHAMTAKPIIYTNDNEKNNSKHFHPKLNTPNQTIIKIMALFM